MSLTSLNDTISAISTPLGTGGVGIVRISGEKSFEVVGKIFSLSSLEKKVPDFKPNRIYHGWAMNGDSPEDEVIVLSFMSPNSYTGEDVVEIQCHGGVNVVRNILQLCLDNGARLAEKGEFTKRAFLNGKLDLSKAEAVLDIIHSKTGKFARMSARNLSGKLSQVINQLRGELLNLLSLINAGLDFPEEVGEPEYSFIEEKTLFVISEIENILKTANSSNLMRQGIKIAIAGRPNVGKSSLFNALLNIDRAIVTDIAGTTRDIIQEPIDIDGIPAVLVDTAGIRELEASTSSNYIESIGIDIARNYIQEADIVLFVHDLSVGLNDEDKMILNAVKHKPLVKIGSKADIAQTLPDKEILVLSSRTGEGLDNLKSRIKEMVVSSDYHEFEFSTNLRQQECLVKALESLNRSLDACRFGEVQDFIAIDLKAALISLGEITGEVVSDEIINNIFDNFCIGK